MLFGTDGIRGVVNKEFLTAENLVRIGKAISTILNKKKAKVIIGRDTRISGTFLESALSAGFCSMGMEVLLTGVIPTPAISFLVKAFRADLGIMISASHNPSQYNGIKIFDKRGFKLTKEKEKMIEYTFKKEIPPKKVGESREINYACSLYTNFIKNKIGCSLKFKAVVDCANGAAYRTASKILSELGVDVIAVNDKPDGKNINLRCGSLYPEVVQKAVIKNKADIGISLDGDADRVVLVDDKGNILDGDHMMAIIALYLKEHKKLAQNTLVTTVMSNLGLKLLMAENKIGYVETDVGDRNVAQKMLKIGANFGGEQSGHLIFFDLASTGDGTLAAAFVLKIMSLKNKKLSELASVLRKYPQILLNVNVKEKKPFDKMPLVKKAIDKSRLALGKKARILVRYSGTEPLARVMVEGKTKKIKIVAEDICRAIKKEVGV